ncbi:hypothetical protein AB1Y20_012055 [Prymnesium parvum]|uniref:PH domain-containing protein n=1 Tax=Prymnesium parvum TaxID=97485 RepID=A0AB34IN20_PRYPA
MPAVVKSGGAWVENSGILTKGWSRKLLVLHPSQLLVHDGEDSAKKPQLVVTLKGASVADPKNLRAGKFAFRLNYVHDKTAQKLIVATGSLQETMEWINAFKLAGVPSTFAAKGLRQSITPSKEAYSRDADEATTSLLDKGTPKSDSAALTPRGAVKNYIIDFESRSSPSNVIASPRRASSKLSDATPIRSLGFTRARAAASLRWAAVVVLVGFFILVLVMGLFPRSLGAPLQGTALGEIGGRTFRWLTVASGESCADGLMVPGPSRTGLNMLFYIAMLCWTFLGVAIAADIFMVGIEMITSQEKKVNVIVKGKPQSFTVLVWNGTVANLTLMALGSSAPEILLSTIEICSSGFYAGELGPSTIVGSAAFNLLGITAVCVLAIGAEGKKIKDLSVFAITATFSVCAYLWLYVILIIVTPNIVDVWEGIITFMLFPALVYLAYLADTNAFSCMRHTSGSSNLVAISSLGKMISMDEISKALATVSSKLTKVAGGSPAKKEAARSAAALLAPPRSRAFYRVAATRAGTGAKDPALDDKLAAARRAIHAVAPAAAKAAGCTVSFAQSGMCVSEGIGFAVVKAVRTGDLSAYAKCHFRTEATGLAEAGKDYEETQGWLEFPPWQAEASCRIRIIDDNEQEDDEVFSVKLSQPSGCVLGSVSSCDITIEDDDGPGEFFFAQETIRVQESCGQAILLVCRAKGAAFDVDVRYATKDGSARSPSDFIAKKGTLHFPKGVTKVPLAVEIVDDARYEREESFYVTLTELSNGATFASGGSSAVATVVIESDDERKQLTDELLNTLNINVDAVKLSASSWGAQFVDARKFDGEGTLAYTLYIAALPWKMLFACVPPPAIAGGWVCFLVALVFIGLLTALIGDLANHMGCCMGLMPSVTAITFVALGTSLPDTFASRTAALNETHADSSIGNITGSNSVNVFLGLGMPWAVAACYWAAFASEADEATWRARYSKESWYSPDMKVGFAVPAGDLGFSVAVFSTCAIICLALLAARRHFLGFELGGPSSYKIATAAFLTFLWFVYIGLSAGSTYGLFN